MNIENMKCSLCNTSHNCSYCPKYMFNLYNKWNMNTVQDSKINYSIKDNKLLIFINNLIVTYYNNYYYVYNNNKQLIFNDYLELTNYLLELDSTISVEKIYKIINKFSMKGGTHLMAKELAGKALAVAQKQLPPLLKVILKPLLLKLLNSEFASFIGQIEKFVEKEEERQLLGFLLNTFLNTQSTTQKLAQELKVWNTEGIKSAVDELLTNSNIDKIRKELLDSIKETTINKATSSMFEEFKENPEKVITLISLLNSIKKSVTGSSSSGPNEKSTKEDELKEDLEKLSISIDDKKLKDDYKSKLVENAINVYTTIFDNDVDNIGKVINKVSKILHTDESNDTDKSKESNNTKKSTKGGMLSTLTGNDTTDSEKLNGIIKNETEYITTWLLIKLFDNTMNMSVFTDDLYSELVLEDKLKLTKKDMINTMNRTELRMVNYVSEILDINEIDRLFYNTNDDVVFLNEEDEMSLYNSISGIVNKIVIHINDCCNKVEEKRDQFIELNTKETIAKNPDLQNILDKQFNLSNLVCYSNDNVSKTNAVILLFLYLRYNISNTTELNLLNELYSVDLDILDTINFVSVNRTKTSIIRTIKNALLHNDKTISNVALNYLIEIISDSINISKLKKIHLIDGKLLEETNLHLQHILEEVLETLDIRKTNLNIKTTLDLNEIDQQINTIFSSKYYKTTKVGGDNEDINININRLIRYGILKAKLLLVKKQREWIYKNKHIFDVIIHFIISYYKNKEAPNFSESIKDILDNMNDDDNEIIVERRSAYKSTIEKILASENSYIADSEELLNDINDLLKKKPYIEKIGYEDSIPKLEALRNKIAEKIEVEKNVDTLDTKKRVIERDNKRMRQEKVLADDFDKLSKDKDQKKNKDDYLIIIKLFQRVIALYVFYKYTTMQLEIFDKIIDKTIEQFSQNITKNIGSVELFKKAKQQREHMFNNAIEVLENNNNYITHSLNNKLFNINKSDSIERVNLNVYIEEFKKLTDTGLLTTGWRYVFGTELQKNLNNLNNKIKDFKKQMDNLRNAKSNNNGANIISSLNNHIDLIKFTYKVSEKLVNIYYNNNSKTTVDKTTKEDYSEFVKKHKNNLNKIESQTKKRGWIYSSDTYMSKRINDLTNIVNQTTNILNKPNNLKDQLSTNIVKIDGILKQFLEEYKSDIQKLTQELNLVKNFESNVREVKKLCDTIETQQSFLKCNPTTSNFDIPDSRIDIDTVTFSNSNDIDTFFSKEKTTILDSLNLQVELKGGSITFLPQGNVGENLENIIETLMLLFQDNKSLNIEAFDFRLHPFFILKPFENVDMTDYSYTLLTDNDFVNKSFSQIDSKEQSIKLIKNLIDYLIKKTIIKDIDLFSEELLFYYKIPEDTSHVNYWILEIDESKKELLEVFKSTLKQNIRDDYKTTLRTVFDELNDKLKRTLEDDNISLDMRMEELRKEQEENTNQIEEIKISENDVDFSLDEKNKIEFLNSKYRNIKNSKFKDMKKDFNNKIKYINNNALFDYLINLYITKKKTIPIDINSKLIEAKKFYDTDLKYINNLLGEEITSNESSKSTENDLFSFIKEFANTNDSKSNNNINVNTENIASIVSQFQLRDYLKKDNYFKIIVAYSNLDDRHKELNKIEKMSNLPLTIKPRIIKTVYDLLIKSNTSIEYGDEEYEDYDNYQPSTPVVLDMLKSKETLPVSKEPNSMVVFDSKYNKQSSFTTNSNSEIVTIADGNGRKIRITK